jgi:hypothetical protein
MGNTKKLMFLGFFNIVMSFLFVFSNMLIWQRLNGNITANSWGPLQMVSIPQTIINGQAETIGTWGFVPNYPFILFWVTIVGNFVFAVLALRQKRGQP